MGIALHLCRRDQQAQYLLWDAQRVAAGSHSSRHTGLTSLKHSSTFSNSITSSSSWMRLLDSITRRCTPSSTRL